MRVSLRPVKFTDAETVLVGHEGLTASGFRYATEVKGLRISNKLGHISLLPFQGQQIWDAAFSGRLLTMASTFTGPYPTQDYLSTYGAFKSFPAYAEVSFSLDALDTHDATALKSTITELVGEMTSHGR